MVSTTKLFILASLGFVAMILGTTVLTLQLYISQEKIKRGIPPTQILSTSSSGGGGTASLEGEGGEKGGTSTKVSTKKLDDDGNDGDDLLPEIKTENRKNGDSNKEVKKKTKGGAIQPSTPTSRNDLYLNSRLNPPGGSSWKTIGEAFWNQAEWFIQSWDAVLQVETDDFSDQDAYHYTYRNKLRQQPSTLSSSSSSSSTSSSGSSSSASSSSSLPTSFNWTASTPRFALEQAAEAGHPLAQYYLANAYASGIWPVDTYSSEDMSISANLQVFDEWVPVPSNIPPPKPSATSNKKNENDKSQQALSTNEQVTKSFLLWRMAAMAGHVESAMALAYRMETLEDATCEEVLPYYEAAANGIIDNLEASLHSRAKVLPPMDKHSLTQVYMHGGTSSQLDWNNKPHESKEALQFYHMKATTPSWSVKLTSWSSWTSNSSSSSDKDKVSSHAKAARERGIAEGIDVNAAFTLAHLYHYGQRGVPQNLTRSLQYYEIAATNGHWESAGEAGTFHLWGMGTEQNLTEALTFFKLGAPFGLSGCRQKHDQAMSMQHSPLSDIESYFSSSLQCDDQSLNGMGLLHLIGIEGMVQQNHRIAEQYFTLAKEMGNVDAHYNLAMTWLGWKTHFKNVEDLAEDGISAKPDDIFVPPGVKSSCSSSSSSSSDKPIDFALHLTKRPDGSEVYYKGPLQADIAEAMKLLAYAAKKSHIQATHRMGMIYANGIRIQSAALKFDSVKKDCQKSKAYFRWIMEHASPARSRRLRKAYKDYIDGDLESSLRNYLLAAETGSMVGQVNAAFLLERGTCLHLSSSSSSQDCAKASVRLWKAAALNGNGNAEASLRVGDFYYYGRLRNGGGNSGTATNNMVQPVGPFGWVQYFLYPEQYIPIFIEKVTTRLYSHIQELLSPSTDELPEQQCDADADDDSMSCKIKNNVDDVGQVHSSTEDDELLMQADLLMAAHYYQVAVDKYRSPRANFNLGFMYEWGIGLKQDFPLAKRHYDLAVSTAATSESELPVKIALFAMSTHQSIIKLYLSYQRWIRRSFNGNQNSGSSTKNKSRRSSTSSSTTTKSSSNVDKEYDDDNDNSKTVGQTTNNKQKKKKPQPQGASSSSYKGPKTRMEIVKSHLFNWSSFVIIVLSFIILVLNDIRVRRNNNNN